MLNNPRDIQESIDKLKLKVDMFLPKKISNLVFSTGRRSSLPITFMLVNEPYASQLQSLLRK